MHLARVKPVHGGAGRAWRRRAPLGLALALLALLAACGGPSSPTSGPSVTGTTPSDGSADVAIGSDVVVNFSTSMAQGPTESAFGASPAVACDFSWNAAGDRLTCDPQSDLSASTSYTITVGAAAEGTDGSTLGSDHAFSFTTAGGPGPNVTGTTPPDGATDVALNGNVKVRFSEAMNQTATEGAFGASPSIDCTFTWNASGDVLTCNPDTDLNADANYTLTLGTGAESVAGTPLDAAFDVSFATGTTVLETCQVGSSLLGSCVLD